MEWSSVLVCFLYSETVSSPNFESMLTKPYLSWSKSSLINLSESSFPNEILVTKWVCCFFHLLESEDRWLMALFSRWVLILKLPKFYRCEWWRALGYIQGSEWVWSWDLLLLRLFHAETRPPNGIMGDRSCYLFRNCFSMAWLIGDWKLKTDEIFNSSPFPGYL